MANARELLTMSEEETRKVGEDFAAQLSGKEVLCLDGPLGAGKTQFVKGLARGLGFSGEVTSPSFPVVHEYEGGRFLLVHFDFFRLDREEDVRALGFVDYLEEGILAIEWGGKFPMLLSKDVWMVTFEILKDGGRRIAFVAGA